MDTPSDWAYPWLMFTLLVILVILGVIGGFSGAWNLHFGPPDPPKRDERPDDDE